MDENPIMHAWACECMLGHVRRCLGELFLHVRACRCTLGHAHELDFFFDLLASTMALLGVDALNFPLLPNKHKRD